ncbi:MAG: LssY C-terminal domain-containing protein [Candidatus Korobacteraceae bacterium]
MRILLGAARGLAFLYLICTAVLALGCDQLPAGQSLWVRLSAPISTYSARVGDPVRAVLTQDVVCGNDVVLPMGTPVEGVVRSKRKVGWGIRHETAALELEFNRASLGPELTVQMTARVEEVENAREQVKNGVIHGVMSSDTFQGRINSRLIHLPTWNPYSDLGLIIYKATFPIFPEPEIFYPTGTDIRLKTTAAISSPGTGGGEFTESTLPDSPQLDALVQQLPRRSTTVKSVNADLVNLVFLGSQEQVDAAFVAAGWHGADPVSRHSAAHNFYALLNNSGYAQQPMMTFLLNGKPEDMNWQKSLNSYGRRDHLRIWQWTPEGATEPVWVSSSTHDTGAVLSVKYKGFVHHISPDIDNERAKVVRDLNFAGCVESVTYVDRPGISMITQNATGDLMRTDGSIAVLELKDCQPVSPGLTADSSNSHFKPGNHAFRYVRREILTFRNDIWRANIIYGAYDLGRMAVAAMRHPLPPVDTEAKPTVSAFRSVPIESGIQ